MVNYFEDKYRTFKLLEKSRFMEDLSDKILNL